MGACSYPKLERFWQMHDSEHHLPIERTSDPYVLQMIVVSLRSQADGSGGYDERISENAMERGA